MWEFYLAASEMAFREQNMMVFQLQLTKRKVWFRSRATTSRARKRGCAAPEGGSRPPLRLAGE